VSRFTELVEQLLLPHFPNLHARQIGLLEVHYNLMLRWNPRINLTAITEPEEVVTRHYGESLMVAQAIPAGAWKIVDAGSGAGFPGVPLAVVHPECSVTMLEIDIRKGVFIKETTIDVPNAKVRNERLSAYEPGCDWLVSRALHRQELIPYANTHRCSVALLVSEDQLGDIHKDWPEISWGEPAKLPWKGHGVLLTGSYRALTS
jgi:16S rRNA (guanine(527)-N(7))-methyltransferase RsmG